MWTMQRDLDRVATARVRDSNVRYAHRNTGVGCAAGLLAIVRERGGDASWGSEFDADACHVGLGCG